MEDNIMHLEGLACIVGLDLARATMENFKWTIKWAPDAHPPYLERALLRLGQSALVTDTDWVLDFRGTWFSSM